MGWLYHTDKIDNPVAYLTQKYNYDGECHTLRALAAARVSNTVYMAVKFTEKATGNSFVSAVVILISNTKKHGFGYKDMDEGMGPCQCDCPQRIMRLLSPVAALPHARFAAEWRARVEARRQAAAQFRARRQALKVNVVVTLLNDVRFSGGITARSFRVVGFRGKTPIYEPVDRPGFRCRLRSATLAAAAVDAPVEAGSALTGG